DPAADYIIDMDDQASQGADGEVILNGQVLLPPRSAPDSTPRHVRGAIRLLSQNTLTVRLTGKPGSKLKVQVVGGTKLIGVAGGTVRFPGGGITLDVPAGSLVQETEISITPTIDGLPAGLEDV